MTAGDPVDLERIRSVLFESWQTQTSYAAEERRLIEEIIKVASVGAWSSSAVLCGRLVEVLLHRAGVARQTLAKSLDQYAGERNHDGSLRSSVATAGHALRRIRNSAAHFTEEPTSEFEATVAIASYFIVRGGLSPERDLDQGYPLSAKNRAASDVRENWQGMSPTSLARRIARSKLTEVKVIVAGKGVDFYTHLLEGGSISQINRIPQRLHQLDEQSSEFAEALISCLPSLLGSIGCRQANLLYKFSVYLTNPALRELRRVLSALLPFDQTWLTERLLAGSSLSNLSWRVSKLRGTDKRTWLTIGGTGDTLVSNARLVWGSGRAPEEIAHQAYVLAMNSPPELRKAILREAPEEAILAFMDRRVGYSVVAKVFAAYCTNVKLSTSLITSMSDVLARNLMTSPVPARAQFLTSLRMFGSWSREMRAMCEMVLNGFDAATPSSRSVLVPLFLRWPQVAAAHASRLTQGVQEADIEHLIMAGVVSVYNGEFPGAPVPGFEIGALRDELSNGGELTRVELVLAAYTLGLLGDGRKADLLGAAADAPLLVAETSFSRRVGVVLSREGVAVFETS